MIIVHLLSTLLRLALVFVNLHHFHTCTVSLAVAHEAVVLFLALVGYGVGQTKYKFGNVQNM